MIVAVAAAARDAALVPWCTDVGSERGVGEDVSDDSVTGKGRGGSRDMSVDTIGEDWYWHMIGT